jgi:hypothetical protein
VRHLNVSDARPRGSGIDHLHVIAPVGNATCKLIANAHAAIGLSQQQHTAVRGQPATGKGRR